MWSAVFFGVFKGVMTATLLLLLLGELMTSLSKFRISLLVLRNEVLFPDLLAFWDRNNISCCRA